MPSLSLSVGVVGLGFGQQVHLPAFQSIPGSCVSAVCASTLVKAQRVAQTAGVQHAYDRWEDVIESPYVDAVSLALPPRLNRSVVLAALARGKPVLCEKPFATNVDQAEEMAAAAKSARLANMVDFQFRELPIWQTVKELVDSGRIGRLRFGSISWCVETYANRAGIRSWKTETEPGGGTLNSFVSHVFYYVEWLLGSVVRVRASLYDRLAAGAQADNVCSLTLELASGAPVDCTISAVSYGGSGHRIELYGDDGSVTLRNPGPDYMGGFEAILAERRAEAAQVIHEPEAPVGSDGRLQPFRQLATRFVLWALGGEPARPDFADGLRVQHLLDAAQRSHHSGRWMSV